MAGVAGGVWALGFISINVWPDGDNAEAATEMAEPVALTVVVSFDGDRFGLTLNQHF